MEFFRARKEFILFITAITLAVILCIITMQLLVGALIIVAAVLGMIVWHYLSSRRQGVPVEPGEGEAVLAAGLITLVAAANMQWVVWAIGLAFIFMIHQSLARIEKRLDVLEMQTPPKG